ncbi:hypothetical protein KZZ10_00775 [Alcaligenaceae bacterium LF4-65]|jgi:hypothetical protein|uniref:Rap1a immunity protein domain-containing protein n=1 Tax=Zwartia hollandica TaxID=324606 RepID=A0A953N564_9BURK|nr:hypothetical protein [Zwartia hollandica]MBZ1349166.1 hypothetical protein [Zwartia hollandica]
MKAIVLMAVLSIGLVLQDAYASSGLTLAQYREWKKDSIKKEMLTTYTAGMGQGVVFSNVHNKSYNLPQIFCPPGDLPLTGDLTNQILENFIGRNNFKPTDEISIILIFALKNAYPCR